MSKKVELDDLVAGDAVIVIWEDHYRTHGHTPISTRPMSVKSYGEVADISDIGLALIQNLVINATAIGADPCMDGQFILRDRIKEVLTL